jgi:hypothetical protein
VPDSATRASIGASTREHLFGEFIDAMPGRWLVWHAGGLLGPRIPDRGTPGADDVLADDDWTTRRPGSTGP